MGKRGSLEAGVPPRSGGQCAACSHPLPRRLPAYELAGKRYCSEGCALDATRARIRAIEARRPPGRPHVSPTGEGRQSRHIGMDAPAWARVCAEAERRGESASGVIEAFALTLPAVATPG